ncbi:hypothetical protein GCM10007304_37430 [Rhodococcoides trifolii]|uniref:Uncharacterized protein n=1 Tax=Rhodococcoides trifolii TaxID=908250 RepID=A0A917G323_9NOCA|nr:hypothetical protein [Rhodococcus trifolii]GGG20054.1 hypothetical protein GCM10007304_37430 [Rhodococcus trifolii]
MLPLLARKYIYRYLLVAFGFPLLARLMFGLGGTLEQRAGQPTTVSKGLKKIGAFTQRRADKAAGKRK